MKKINFVCERCGGENITRDALIAWSVFEQKWEIISELDCINCEDCDREVHIKEIEVE